MIGIRRQLTLVGLTLSMLLLATLPGAAAEWTRYRLGDVSFEAPQDWKVVRRARDREYTLQSDGGTYELRVEWWLPDEPLLGFDDIVWHRKTTLAGQPALMIYSRTEQTQTLQVALDKPRQDGRQLLIVFDARGQNLQNGSPVLDAILARLAIAGTREGGISDGPPARKDAAAPPRTAPESAKLASDASRQAMHTDEVAQLSVSYPQSWTRSTAERDGLRIVTMAPPGKQGVVLIVAARAGAGQSAKQLITAYEEQYYQDYAVPDSIEGDDDTKIGNRAGRYVDMFAEIYPIEGLRLPFNAGRTWLFKSEGEPLSYIVAVIHARDAAPELARQLKAVAGAIVFGPPSKAPSPASASITEAQKAPVSNPTRQAEQAPPAATPQTAPLFAGAMSEEWREISMSGGDFKKFARFGDRTLIVDVPAGNSWGKTGIRTTKAWVKIPARTAKDATRLAFAIDPVRSQNFAIALIPAKRNGDDDWNAHHIRFGVSTEAGGKPTMRLWIEREEHSSRELAETPSQLILELRPDGEVLVRDGKDRILAEGVAPEITDPDGYHVYVLSHARASAEAATLALREVKLSKTPFEAAGDEPGFLAPGQTQKQVLFDGTLLRRAWKRYSAHGGDFSKHARLDVGALVVDVPKGARWGKTGLYSEEALVWLDGEGDKAAARLTFHFEAARTTGFVVALSAISGLNGNDPSNPKFLLHWRKTGENSARVSILRDYDTVKQIDLATASSPEQVSLRLTNGQVAVEMPDWGLAPFTWPDVAPGAGLRVYAYSHPDKAEEPVRMALRRIDVERSGGDTTEVIAKAGTPPLPIVKLFAGDLHDRWEHTSATGAEFAKQGRFEEGLAVTEAAAKQYQWAKTGLVTREPVVQLDERSQMTSYRLRLRFDKKRTSGTQIILNGDKRPNMWDGRRASVALIRHSMGRHADQYVLSVEGDGYRQWWRAIDAAWMDKNWDGTLEIDIGASWLTARVRGAGEVRGANLPIYKGDRLHVSVTSHPERSYGASSMALAEIDGQWQLPRDTSAVDRWTYVDNDRFDTNGFLDDVLRNQNATGSDNGAEPVSDDALIGLITAPQMRPIEMPAAVAPQRGGSLWLLESLIASAHAAPAADCSKAIDEHIDRQRRIKITLGEQPDLVKSFVDLGKTIVGNKSFGDEDAMAEKLRNGFNTVMGSVSDGIAIGEDWKEGKKEEVVLRIMQAALNIGLGSDALKDERTFRNLDKTMRDTWYNAIKKLPPERGEQIIIDLARRFNPSARIDPKGICEQVLKEGSKFDWGTVVGEFSATQSAPDRQKATSAAMWTMTNTALTTFNPNYAMAKAAADTMLEAAKAAKAFAVNDRVGDMYRIWKDEMVANPGLGDYDFYKARTVRGDRLPLNEVKSIIRGTSSQEVSDELAEKKLFDMFRKWHAAEREAGEKGDRLSGLKKRFGKLDCRSNLARTAWPKGRSPVGKAWDDFKAGESWGEGISEGWRNYWNSCRPDIELLDKYADLEAQIRTTYERWMKKGNECNNKALIDTDVDIFMCNLLRFGEDQYRKSMMQRLKDCKLVKEPGSAEKASRAAHVLERIRRLNNDKLTRVLKDLGITPPADLMHCLCRQAGYGSSSTSQYYHPETIGEFNRKYSCSQPGDPCIVSGFGCTRHPLPNWAAPWDHCIGRHKLGQTKDSSGKTIPDSGSRLDEVIEERLRERAIAR